MSEYEDVIKLIDAEHETYVGTATIYIPKLRKALEKENKSKEEIKDRILNDCEKYWERRTIMDALGEDFKDVKKREAGQKGAEKKKQIAIQVSTDGQTSSSDDDNRAAMIAATTEKLHKVYPDIEEKDDEDRQIEINDIQTALEQTKSEKQRISQALDKAHERNKEQQEEINRLQSQLEKATKTSPLDIPPQTPTVCTTEMKAKTKIQLYLSNELMLSFFKRHGVEHARDIPNMTIYGEVTNYMKDDDLAIGKIGTIRSAI